MVAVVHTLTSSDTEAEEWRLRCDMAAVFRVAARLVPPVIDSAVDFRIDGSAMTEMHRDRETDCREEVCGEAQR